MSFNWSELLDLAKILTRKGSKISANEACLRSAVSRAYFGAFCKVRNFARDREHLTLKETAEDHTIVKNYFCSFNDKNRREIGNTLHDLRLNRNKADYRDFIAKPCSLAHFSIRRAHKVIDLLSAL